MNVRPHHSGSSRRLGLRREAGFTMIEIAFSIAIVAFALVAIMGVLPTGMTVQKDNREDTLINQDGMFWLESLRSGSRGIDDLTNYVEQITISNRITGNIVWNNTFDSTTTDIKSGEQIVGLLSTPKYFTNGPAAGWYTNVITARVRAINGPAAEKGNPNNEFTFRYELRSEVTPMYLTPPNADASLSVRPEDANGKITTYGPLHDATVAANLSNLRLTLRWPLFQQGTNWGVGRNRRTVRGLTSGRLRQTTNSIVGTQTNYFIEPNVYAYVSKDDVPKATTTP